MTKEEIWSLFPRIKEEEEIYLSSKFGKVDFCKKSMIITFFILKFYSSDDL